MRKDIKLTDEQLVSAYAAGDNAAFDTLLLRHKDRLFTYIYQMVRDSDLADDIFQETFVKVIMTVKQGRYQDMGKFSAWVTRIARNLVIDSFRAEKSEATISTDNEEIDILNRRELSENTIEDAMTGSYRKLLPQFRNIRLQFLPIHPTPIQAPHKLRNRNTYIVQRQMQHKA